MNDQTTTVLYTLTTLAQSCAALAAFVGAVGIFRLQLLRDGRNVAEQNLRRLAVAAMQCLPEAAPWLPIEQITQELEKERSKVTTNSFSPVAVRALDGWRAFEQHSILSRRWLMFFEAWNLLVIGVSLIGFNFVAVLAGARWFSCTLLAVAVVTALVPFWCVIVWTREVEK